MKLIKLFFIASFVLFGFSAFSQSPKTLDIYFYEQPHMFFKSEKTNDYSGVEADILKEFMKWCQEKKKITVTPKYHPYKTFNDFYAAMESAPANSLGAGTITINEERKQSFEFSAPYLKNVAVFVSHGTVPTFALQVTDKTAATSRASAAGLPPAAFSSLVGLVEKGSVHANYMRNFVGKYGLTMEIQPVAGNLSDVLISDPKYVAYMDIITYRELLKKNPEKYFKIHRELTMKGENFGFMLPQKSEWTPLINEFMESGFGFTATRQYQNILESYLGFELINTVDMF